MESLIQVSQPQNGQVLYNNSLLWSIVLPRMPMLNAGNARQHFITNDFPIATVFDYTFRCYWHVKFNFQPERDACRWRDSRKLVDCLRLAALIMTFRGDFIVPTSNHLTEFIFD